MKRSENSFNLSFIDIISCGLGAVVLLLVLIKDSPFFDTSELQQSDYERNDTSDLEEQISTLKDDNNYLDELIAKREISLNISNKELQQLIKELNDIEIEEIIEEQKDDETETFLSSCALERDKSLILLDTSSSMLDYDYVEIIKSKSRTDIQKLTSKKLNLSKDLVSWLIKGADDDIRINVGYFSDNVELFFDDFVKKKEILNDASFTQNLKGLVPSGGTNLYDSFKSIDLKKYSSIFFITDGLPTMGRDSNKKISKNSPKFLQQTKCNRETLVSSNCREKYFLEAFDYLISENRFLQINTLLLYLEGDPRSVLNYGIQSKSSGGCFITIPKDWP